MSCVNGPSGRGDDFGPTQEQGNGSSCAQFKQTERVLWSWEDCPDRTGYVMS